MGANPTHHVLDQDSGWSVQFVHHPSQGSGFLLGLAPTTLNHLSLALSHGCSLTLHDIFAISLCPVLDSVHATGIQPFAQFVELVPSARDLCHLWLQPQ